MNDKLIQNIINYMDYLASLSLEVSYCDANYNFVSYLHILMPYNSHRNNYCMFIKDECGMHYNCRKRQKIIHGHCKSGEFYGMCYAGVEEFVFPVYDGDTVLAFISVSGYRGALNGYDDCVKRLTRKFPVDEKKLAHHYLGLKTNIPSTHYLQSLIYPLCSMFTLLYLKLEKPAFDNNPKPALKEIFDYISENFTKNISLSDISNHTHYSMSYISHLFKQETKFTIPHYIMLLRISNAKDLLKNTDFSISKIAADIGYNEPNYFANVFHKETGMSPKKFREAQHTKKQ